VVAGDAAARVAVALSEGEGAIRLLPEDDGAARKSDGDFAMLAEGGTRGAIAASTTATDIGPPLEAAAERLALAVPSDSALDNEVVSVRSEAERKFHCAASFISRLTSAGVRTVTASFSAPAALPPSEDVAW
jgi:hypothetical protein